MQLKIGDRVQLKSFHELKGIITWIDPKIDDEGRVMHIECKNETYRLNESSLELVNQDKTKLPLS